MNLIFLYGPPGVGKLTVGKELAKLTGYKLFHNQLTVDLVHSLFDWGTPLYNKFVKKYRFELLAKAAQTKVDGVIYTYCYCKAHDRSDVKKIFSQVIKNGGKIYCVQLSCSRAVLFKRIQHPLRKRHRKVTSVDKLKKTLQKHDLFSKIDFYPSILIKNTILTPRQAAQQIVKRVKFEQ